MSVEMFWFLGQSDIKHM